MRIGVTMLTSLSVNASATVQRAEEMKKSQQGVAPYVAQGATKVNADVGVMKTENHFEPIEPINSHIEPINSHI